MPVLTGRYALGDLTGRAGEVLRFTPSTTIVGPDVVVLPDPVTVELDSDGAFSVELVGTDDPAYAPSGWVWVVQELMNGGRTPWSFVLTADTDLADVAQVVTPPEYDAFTLTVADTVTGAPGSAADVTIAGSPPGQSLTFTIPRGDVGAEGDPGPANALAIGSVTTGAAGSSAAATITGTPPSQTLALTIPRGDTGATGAPGAPSSLYNAHTILAAVNDDDPQPLTVGASTLVGRAASGDIAALSVADVRTLVGTTRVTRPLTDDRLVEVWNGATWSVVEYDSGLRDVSSLITSPAKFQTWYVMRLRRVGNRVTLIVRADVGTGTAFGTYDTIGLLSIPAGFATTDYGNHGFGCYGYTAPVAVSTDGDPSALLAYAPGGTWGASAFTAEVSWVTGQAIPTSLPGTLITAAPA